MQQLSKQERLELRNQRIRKRFNELSNVKHLKTERTLEILADEYLELTKDTIWLIITETGFYKKDKKQNEKNSTIPNLFNSATGTNDL